MKSFLINLIYSIGFLYARVAVASSEAHGGAEHHGNPGPSMGTAMRGINFILLVILLYVLLKKPVKEFFASRAVLLKKDIEESGQHYSELLKQSEELNHKISRLEFDSHSSMKTFKEEAEHEKERLLAHAKDLSTKMKQEAQSLGVAELKKAKEELRELAVNLAARLAEQKIRQDISAADQERLNAKFVDRIKTLN